MPSQEGAGLGREQDTVGGEAELNRPGVAMANILHHFFDQPQVKERLSSIKGYKGVIRGLPKKKVQGHLGSFERQVPVAVPAPAGIPPAVRAVGAPQVASVGNVEDELLSRGLADHLLMGAAGSKFQAHRSGRGKSLLRFPQLPDFPPPPGQLQRRVLGKVPQELPPTAAREPVCQVVHLGADPEDAIAVYIIDVFMAGSLELMNKRPQGSVSS
jgi:hypothetical protein